MDMVVVKPRTPRAAAVPLPLRSDSESPAQVLCRLLDGADSVAALARTLGVNESTVYRWMRRFGVRLERPGMSQPVPN